MAAEAAGQPDGWEKVIIETVIKTFVHRRVDRRLLAAGSSSGIDGFRHGMVGGVEIFGNIGHALALGSRLSTS